MKIISKCESLKIITLIIFRGCRLTRFSKSVLTTTTSSEPCITFLLLRIGKTKICICILILYSTQISKVLLKLTPTLADVHYGDNWTEDILNLVQLELPLSIFFMFCYLWNQLFPKFNILRLFLFLILLCLNLDNPQIDWKIWNLLLRTKFLQG